MLFFFKNLLSPHGITWRKKHFGKKWAEQLLKVNHPTATATYSIRKILDNRKNFPKDFQNSSRSPELSLSEYITTQHKGCICQGEGLTQGCICQDEGLTQGCICQGEGLTPVGPAQNGRHPHDEVLKQFVRESIIDRCTTPCFDCNS